MMTEQREEDERQAMILIDLFATASFKDGTIPRTRVWDRVLSAVMASAAASDTFGEFVEGVAEKLQMTSFFGYEATLIKNVRDVVRWAEVRRLMERETRYLVGMVRAERDERKATREATR